MTNPEKPSILALKERFGQGARDLAAGIPVSVASISIRRTAGGPLDVILTLGFTEGDGTELAPLVIGDAAAQWFEANLRELVLDVRPDHVKSEFYRPFTQHGLQSVVVLPIFGEGGLVGTVAFGAEERHAWTRRHLKLMQLLAAQLAPEFPHPAPAAPAPESREEHSLRAAREEKPASAAPPGPTTPHEDDAHVEADALGRVREWDPAAERLFGIPRETALGVSLAIFYRETGRRLLAPRLVDELTARGRFTGRVLAWDSEGRELACEVDLLAVRTPAGARGFRGRFRLVETPSPLPADEVRFDVARRYAFANSVKPA